MKKVLLSICLIAISIASYSQVSCNGTAPSTVNLTDKVGICNGNLQRTATVGQILAAGGSATIDSSKVFVIAQGRGSTPFLLYFNGTAWVKNDTSYAPLDTLAFYPTSAELGANVEAPLAYNPLTKGFSINSLTGYGTSGQVMTSTGSAVQWADPTGGGGIDTISGTTNRINVTGTTNKIIDISSSYVGQSSIQTVGNISSGAWTSSSKIGIAYGGTNADLSTTGGTSHFLKQGTVGGNVSVSPIKSVDLDSLYTPLGRVITEDFTSSFSNFTNLTGNTATYSIVSNSIECVGGTTFTLTSGKRQSTFGRTTTQKWTITSDIIVGTIGTNTHGVGISLQSTVSTNRSVQFVLRLNTAKVGKLETYTDSDTSTSSPTYSITSTGISVLAGDRVRLTVTRLGNSYIFKAFNTTAGARYGSSITIEKNTFKTGALTPFTNPANGEFAFNICGGTHYFDNYYVDAGEVKQAEIMWIGDSIIDFSNGMNISQGAPATLQKMINGRVVPYATGGCKVEDINPIDASRYKSKIVIISLSINNVTAGDDTTTYKTKVAALVNPLVDSGLVLGTSLFLTEIMPSSAASVLLHNQCLKNNYNTSLIRTYNSFNNGSGSIKTSLSSGDASHPNFAGLRLLARIVYQDLQARGLVTPKFNDTPHDNTLFTTDNGSVYIGEKLSEPTSPITVWGSETAINIRPTPYYTSRSGGFINSATKSNVDLRGGNYLGSSTIATASGGGIVRIDSTGIGMFTDTSLTAGSSYTPTSRMKIGVNGNVGIGSSPTTSRLSITAVGGVSLRESGMEFNISDSGTDKIFMYNGTSTDASFIPSIGGICNTSSARSALQNVAFVTSGNDTGTEPLMKMVGFQTTSSSYPINGTLTVVTTRPIFAVYNRTTLLQTTLANGNVGIGNSSPTARLHITSTTSPQLRVSYDPSNVLNVSVSSSGLATFGGNGSFQFDGTVTINGNLILKSYTVATLPTPTANMMVVVTDALAPTYNATVVGGGAERITVLWNGSAWKCH